MSAMFRSLGILNYRIWFIGAIVSNIGTWMQRTAQDWYVLTELTDNDAAAVGITLALQFGPALVIGPYAGIIADRLAGRRLIATTQSVQAFLALVLGEGTRRRATAGDESPQNTQLAVGDAAAGALRADSAGDLLQEHPQLFVGIRRRRHSAVSLTHYPG